MIIKTAANNPCIIQNFITIVASWFHFFSNKWCNGATSNNFLWNIFFQNICKKLVVKSTINGKNKIKNGIIIQILIFKTYTNVAKSHHIEKAPLSHMKIFAGNILKNINDAKTAHTITTNVVAMYVWFTKATTARTNNSTHINPPANQSSQSVILIAFTMAMVNTNVKIGQNIHRWIFHAIGRRFM